MAAAVAALLITVALAFVISAISPADAAGSPDIDLSKDMPPETLYGAETEVTLTADNPTGTSGFNLSLNDVLPPGATYVPGSASVEPTTILTDPDGNQVLIWENVADLLAGATVEITYRFLADDPDFVVGDTITNNAGAYVSTSPVTIPDFDPITGEATGDFTGFDTASDTTELIPFQITKTEPSQEGELLRGAHDHPTTYTILVENNLVNASTDFEVHDWIPAGLEFMGCGGVDNSETVTEEYPGSGALNPPVPTGCVEPTLVETVSTDPAGPAPAGVYTHVVWDSAILGDLLAGESFTLTYSAAIPLQENVLFSAEPTTGHAANLDNNTGALTSDEQGLNNYAGATATYTGDGLDYTVWDEATVVAEDVSIHKTVDGDEIAQGDVSTWTLQIETSEYASNTDSLTITDSLPDGLCPIGPGTPCAGAGPNPSPAADSIVPDGDGSWTITWTLTDLPANTDTSIVFSTQVLDTYDDGAPVAANDTWQNDVDLAGTATVIADGTGATTSVPVIDSSSAGQSGRSATLAKEVSVPPGGVLDCGDGSGVTWDATEAGDYGPGDRVCWRLRAVFPSTLDTLEPTLVDFLPNGFTLESVTDGAGHTATGFTFSSTSGRLEWQADEVEPGAVFEQIVSTIITDPDAANDGDIAGNLLKMGYVNSVGDVFQQRDQANADWAEPVIDLTKGVIQVNSSGVPGAPADDVSVFGGDQVTYQVDVVNSGGDDAIEVSVRDTLPSQLDCGDVVVGTISDSGTCSAPDTWIQWDGLTVPANSTLSLTYTLEIPATAGAGSVFDNTAGVRSFERETNRSAPDDGFLYTPSSNIDPDLEASANTDPADDPSSVFITGLTVAKDRDTSITEPQNPNGQATIGETITYTLTITIPEGVTAYDVDIADSISDRITHVPGTATATYNGVDITLLLTDTADEISLSYPSISNPAGSGDDVIVIEFEGVVDDEAQNARGNVIPNRVDVDWASTPSGPQDQNEFATANTRIVEPFIVASKGHDDGDGIIQAGQTIVFTVTATNDEVNQWVSRAHEGQLIDTVPDQLTPLEGPGDPAEDGDTIPPDGGTWDEATRTITWDLTGFIEPNDSTSRQYSAVAEDPLVGGVSITNTVVAETTSMPGVDPGERDAESPNGGPGSGYTDDASVTLTAPELAIAKSVDPGTATVGESVEYTVEVTIPADVILFDVSVIDDLPTGVVFDSTISTACDQGGSACSPLITVSEIGYDGDVVAWTLGDLATPAAEDRVVTIVYEAHLDDIGAISDGATLTNGAVAVGNQTDAGLPPVDPPDPGDFDVATDEETADVDVVEPSLTLDKSVVGQIGDSDFKRAVPGETLTYQIVVENTGTSPAYDIDISDTPDARLVLVDVSDGAGYTVVDGDPGDGTLSWHSDGPLAVGDSLTVTYQLQVPADWNEDEENAGGAEIVNTADVPHYFGVAPGDQVPGRDYRDYDDVDPDTVEVEVDLASIGDRVWYDVNGDGVQDPGEPGLEGVEVTVTYLGIDGVVGGGDDEVHVVTTGTNGLYLVEDLPGGTYTVVVTGTDIPAGLAPSYDLDTGTVSPDGEWEGALAEDGAPRDVDFGYTGTGSIGDTIWFDRDGDGAVGAEEPPLAGVDVTVTWLGFDGSVGGGDDIVFSDTTDTNGSYLVDLLPAGEYIVEVDTDDIPAGMDNVTDPDGGGDSTSAVTLAAGEDDLDQDFGYRGSGSIGDFVWLDLDNDGVADAGEQGIVGAAVELTWAGQDGTLGNGDDVVFTASTQAGGLYLFDFLPPGEYEVNVVGGLPSGVDNTYDEDGDLDSSTPVSLADGSDHLTADFGYGGSTSIGDLVWWDIDGDGVRDAGEPGLSGIEVTVTYAGPDDTFGTPDDQDFVTTTDADGDYLVTGLPSGDFRVTVTDGVPGGLDAVYDEDDGTGSPDGETFVLGLGIEAHLTADFGYQGTGSIGDTVWNDLDGDGTLNGTEPGLSGVTVTLVWHGPDGVANTPDDITLQTTTDANGVYGFAGLPAGGFEVSVDPSTIPVGLDASYDLDGTLDHTTVVTLTTGETRDDVDFGYQGTGSIGDTIWLDLDGGGDQNLGEPGIPGVQVDLVWAGPDGTLDTADDFTWSTTTDADGLYLFEDLPPGAYRVEVVTVPAGLTNSADPDGGAADISLLTLGAAEDNMIQDFGYVGTGSIGDTVWFDLDGDGSQTADEPGAPGIGLEVILAGVDGTVGTADDIVVNALTDADGLYLVEGLPSGDIEVNVDPMTIPDGVAVGGDYDGGNPTSTQLTLTLGETNLDIDYPLIGDASLDGVVWSDDNGDGIRDPSEVGVEGVTLVVTWDGPAGPVEFTVVTGPDGTWTLPSIPPGDYTVRIDTTTVPDGLGLTTPESVDVTVPPMGTGHVEHGLAPLSSIGSYVWIDSNENGIRDGIEPGLNGVVVELLDEEGNVVATLETDIDGGYLFTDLLPGTYTVRVDASTLPEGLIQVADRDGVEDGQTTVTVAGGDAVLDANFGYLVDDDLPFTGIDADLLATAALLMILFGAVVLSISRRDLGTSR